MIGHMNAKAVFPFLSLLIFPVVSQALLVVGDSDASSAYTDGAGAGSDWDYVGHLLGSAPSSVTYVSNQWFVTAHHVWDNDVVGKGQTTLDLGGTTYTINTGSKVAITNASGSEADLCMFRVTDSVGLPTGIQAMESTVGYNNALLMIGNGFDNDGNTGMTWGDGSIYSVSPPPQTYTGTQDLNGRSTTYFLSVYNSEADGSALAQTYDSGGGAFANGELAGIMVATGSLSGDDVTLVADAGAYGAQINSIAAVPEPVAISLLSCAGLISLMVSRIRRRLL